MINANTLRAPDDRFADLLTFPYLEVRIFSYQERPSGSEAFRVLPVLARGHHHEAAGFPRRGGCRVALLWRAIALQ